MRPSNSDAPGIRWQASLVVLNVPLPLGQETRYAAATLDMLVVGTKHRPCIFATSIRPQPGVADGEAMAMAVNGAQVPEALSSISKHTGPLNIQDAFAAAFMHMLVASGTPTVLVAVAGASHTYLFIARLCMF